MLSRIRPPGRAAPHNSEALLVFLQMAVVLAAVVSVALNPLPHWHRALVYLAVAGVAANMVALAAAFLGVAPDWAGPAGTLANAALAVALQLATGGLRSPVKELMMLALAGIAIRFPYRQALALGAGLIAADAVAAALTVNRGDASLGPLFVSAVFRCLALFILCALAGLAAAQRDRLLRVAAHELRNPMAAIAAITPVLRRRLAGRRPPEESLRTVEVLQQEVERLADRLDEVLQAFRLQEGLPGPRRSDADLTLIAAAAARPFIEFEQAHPVRCEGLDAGPVWVRGDPPRLEQVVRNLLGNAVKYSPDGGDISLRLRRAARTARLEVADSGIGIPPRQINRIFDPFFRCDNAAGADPGGLGLGLFICRDVVRRHGGRLWAESVLGQGSTFHMDLPLARDPRRGGRAGARTGT